MDAVTFEVQCFVDTIQGMVEQGAVEPIRPKLNMATKVESIFKKINDTIEIPDASDIERKLHGCADEVQEKRKAVKKLINFRKFIPVFFQSKENFFKYADKYPVLAIFLAIKLTGVHPS